MMGTEREAESLELQPVHLHGVSKKITELSLDMKENGRRLEKWLRAHPAVVQDIWGPGARKACAILRTYLQTDLPGILWQSYEGACAPAALVHGIQLLRGRMELKFTESFSKNYNRRYTTLQN